MDINYAVPFYSNTPDDTHCFQAGLRMVLKYFFPNEEYSWEELENITAKKEGLWTWPMAGLLWVQEKGIEVKDIEYFDYERFIQEGGKYLLSEFGEEVGHAQIQHSDIEQEQALSKKFIQHIAAEKRIPEISEIETLLEDRYIVCCNVNGRRLIGQEGYSAHLVVVKGVYEGGFFVHDPGLPPRENIQVSKETFDKAWSYPDKKARNIIAFRKK